MTDRASSYQERWSLRHVFHKRRIDSLATPARVLDAGCGSGVLCRPLADRRCTVTGVDREPARVAWCQLLVPEGEFLCAGVTRRRGRLAGIRLRRGALARPAEA